MIRVVLLRRETSPQGTFGVLLTGRFLCYTGELPYHDNKPNVSCVEAGDYLTVCTYSPKFGRFLYLLGNVPNRSGIRIHPANLMGDRSLGFRTQLNGCIALGEKLGTLDGQKALFVSGPAVRRLEESLGRRPFLLEIRWI